MKKGGTEQPRSSWRDIQQRNQGVKTTLTARRRRLLIVLRAAMAVLLLGALVAGALGLRYFAKTAAQRAPSTAPVLAELSFRTNGVLTEQWFRGKFGDRLQQDIRQIEVRALKEQLEREGQVATATVALALPASLKVELEEREPFLRVRVRGSDGLPATLLLARDGTVYAGAFYPEETLRRLPGVAGLRLREEAGGYAPVRGLEPVVRLMEHARQQLPAVYRHWRVVDLGDWNPGVRHKAPLVRIRSAHIEELVFSTDNIEEQVARLGGILAHTQRNQMGQPKFIDLSLGDEVIIRYK